MDLSSYQHTETITINASPEAVYDLVADITRMGEWSPVCSAGEWLDDAKQWFAGTNTIPERTWTTKCRVDSADRGHEFAFVNCGMEGDTDLVHWAYTFAPQAGGTEVVESWQVLPGYEEFMSKIAPSMNLAEYLDGVAPKTREGMAETLSKLKAVAEG